MLRNFCVFLIPYSPPPTFKNGSVVPVYNILLLAAADVMPKISSEISDVVSYEKSKQKITTCIYHWVLYVANSSSASAMHYVCIKDENPIHYYSKV